MMLVPPFVCVTSGVGFIIPHLTEEESKAQRVVGPHEARSHNLSQGRDGTWGPVPLLSIFLGGSTENLSPHTGLTAWIYKQSGKGHLMRKQNVFKRPWKKNKKRGLGLAWSYIHFFLTWKVASYRYYFVVCFFYLSVCPRNLSISVLEEF